MDKKRLTILVIFLAVVLVLVIGVCIMLTIQSGNAENSVPSTATEAPATAPTESTAAPTTEPTTVPTTEPAPVLYANPLTGEEREEPFETRLFTCTISNVIAALPIYGVNESDIFFEMLVNGGATRGLAMFADVASAGEMGSIRSARDNFVDICEAYDAVLAYSGGAPHVLNKIANCGIAHLPDSGGYYYRHDDRVYGGFDYEHCLTTSGADLLEYAQAWEYRTTTERDGYGLNFTAGATPDGEDASRIDYNFWYNSRAMVYNEETGMYEYWMYGEPSYDYFTEEANSFKNVFLLQMLVYNSDIYHLADLDGTGVGYYACNGKIIPIQWHHEDEYEPFTFTLMDGTPLEMDIGNSYIGFVPDDDPITWE